MSIAALIAEVKEMQTAGQTSVQLNLLQEVLEETQRLEAASTDAQWQMKFRELTHQSNLAHYDAQHQANLAEYNARHADSLALLQSALTGATDAIKAALIINGGAALAILAYLGNSHSTPTRTLASSLAWFTAGIIVAAFCSGGYYLTQYHYAQRKEVMGNCLRWVTAVLVVISFLAFAGGAYTAYRGFVDGMALPSPLPRLSAR